MGQVTKLRLSCYQVLLSVDSKTRYKTATVPWADPHLSETMFGTKQPVNNSRFNLIFYKKKLVLTEIEQPDSISADGLFIPLAAYQYGIIFTDQTHGVAPTVGGAGPWTMEERGQK